MIILFLLLTDLFDPDRLEIYYEWKIKEKSFFLLMLYPNSQLLIGCVLINMGRTVVITQIPY